MNYQPVCTHLYSQPYFLGSYNSAIHAGPTWFILLTPASAHGWTSRGQVAPFRNLRWYRLPHTSSGRQAVTLFNGNSAELLRLWVYVLCWTGRRNGSFANLFAVSRLMHGVSLQLWHQSRCFPAGNCVTEHDLAVLTTRLYRRNVAVTWHYRQRIKLTI